MHWGAAVAAGLAFLAGYIFHWAKTEDEWERAEPEDPVLPLNRSWLCIECDWIAGSAVQCPRCGSKALLSVARLIFSDRSLPKR